MNEHSQTEVKSERKPNRWPKWVGPMFGPQPVPNKPITAGNPPENINQQTDHIISTVLREGVTSISHKNAASAALLQVNMVNACAGPHDDFQRREEGEGIGGEGRGAQAENGAYGAGVAGEEGVSRIGWMEERVEESEALAETG